MSNKVITTLDNEEQRYVVRSESGITCWGYDNALDEVRELERKLRGKVMVDASFRGTMELLNYHAELLEMAKGLPSELWFNYNTPPKVRKVLEACRRNRRLVRIWLGDPVTGRSWLEENDVVGEIGRSNGILKVPLLIWPGEFGGGAILDHCIVRISEYVDGTDLYKHPKFHVPKLIILDNRDPKTKRKYPFNIVIQDEVDPQKETVHARFKSYSEACALIAFLNGDSIYAIRPNH